MTFKNLFSALAVLAFAGFFSASVSAQSSPLKPGAWEIRISTTLNGKKTQISKDLVCYTKTYLARRPVLAPDVVKAKSEKNKLKCSVSDVKQSDKTASWRMVCDVFGLTSDHLTNNSASERAFKSVTKQKVKKGGVVVDEQIIEVYGIYSGECTDNMKKLK